jgi:hypothetical protein
MLEVALDVRVTASWRDHVKPDPMQVTSVIGVEANGLRAAPISPL